MLRYDQSPTSNSIYFESSADDKGQSPRNSSINSAISAGGLQSTASSSKAVLAALRALQDKIRRLEVEKTQALDDAAQLRTQLKSQEIESEHAKERDTINQQKSLQEARVRYEAVLAEKTEMEAKVRQLEQHNQNLEHELESVKAQNKGLEANHTSSEDKLQDLQDQISQLESQLESSRLKEKDLSSAMLWESKRHDDEMSALSKKLEAVTADMSTNSVACVEKETKLVELDHLVGQLLAVNQTLVTQLSDSSGVGQSRSRSTTRKATTTKKKKVSKKSSGVPRAASTSTASIDAKVAATAERRRARSMETKRDGSAAAETAANAERLLGMHEMYVTLASTITGKKMGGHAGERSGKKFRTSLGGASVSSSRSMSSLGVGSAPTRPKTRIKGRKMANGESLLSASAGIMGIRHDDANIRPPVTGLDEIESKYNLSDFDSIAHPAPSPTGIQQSSEELQGVISSLEDEFNSLNTQYQELLSTSSGIVGGHGSESQSRELVAVIQKLHKKGEQLRSLKSPTK